VNGTDPSHGQLEESPKSAVALAYAMSEHNKTSNRLWGVTALLSILAVSASHPEGVTTLFGAKLQKDDFYISIAVLLAVVNIAYCSAHMQAHQVARLFEKLVVNIVKTSPTISGIDTRDYLYTLQTPNFNRVYPLTHGLPRWAVNPIYRALKIIVDVCYIFTPVAGMLIAYNEVDLGASRFSGSAFVNILLLSVIAFSALMSILLLGTAFARIWDKRD